MDPNPKGNSMHTIKKFSLNRWFAVALVAFAALLLFAPAGGANAAAPKAAAAATTAVASTASTSVKQCSSMTKPKDLPTLRRGDSGPCVRFLQQLVLSHEVMIGTGQPDGKFGPGTLKGVKNFQAWNKVKGGPDGVVGQNTWKALLKPYDMAVC